MLRMKDKNAWYAWYAWTMMKRNIKVPVRTSEILRVEYEGMPSGGAFGRP